MIELTAHLVVSDADAAAEWYSRAFGAREVGRVPLPGGRVMTIEMRIGDSAFHLAGEFPEAGIVSPLGISTRFIPNEPRSNERRASIRADSCVGMAWMVHEIARARR